jgi:hypothetical protein
VVTISIRFHLAAGFERVPSEPLGRMLALIIANNRAGGWRRLKGRSATD